MTPQVSVIVPTIRPPGAARCMIAARVNAGVAVEWEFLSEEDKTRMGAPKMVKKLTDRASHDLVCFLGDDCIPQRDYLKIALEEMAKFEDGWGLVGFEDGTGRRLPCHWLAHKKLLPHLGGAFFYTGYRHCFCDNELAERCDKLGRFSMAVGALVEHDHPMVTGRPMASDYKRIYSREWMDHDRTLYEQRRRLWQAR